MTLFKKKRGGRRRKGKRAKSTTHSPPLNDGDDVIDLDVELVGLVKVLQSAHVRGHRLRVTEKHSRFTQRCEINNSINQCNSQLFHQVELSDYYTQCSIALNRDKQLERLYFSHTEGEFVNSN